jgi:hypothetical protein
VGHLFVVHGDLHRLDCDGWLLPTDAAMRIEPWAAEAVTSPPAIPDGWHGRVRTVAVERAGDPPVWLTDVGADRAMPMDWYLDGVRAFVEAAGTMVQSSPSPAGPAGRLPARERPLLGLPLVATGRGGMQDAPDRVLRELLPALTDLAGTAGVDLALVTPDRLRYDAAQAARRHLLGMEQLFGPELSAAARDAAEQLADRVPEQLGLFVGAGISMGAGLPGWQDLLVEVAARLDDGALADELRTVLGEGRLDPLDVASLLVARLRGGGRHGDRALREAVASITQSVRRHSLAHGLLASLGVGRAVTTNYDDLYERARAGARRPVAVLPYQRPATDADWLLKLHGDVHHLDDVVLTRQDFLRYAADRNALTGVVHALLLTQHLLFVGYSLSDPNFHRTVDEVRQALARAGDVAPTPFGTVLVAEPPTPAVRDLWGRDLEVVVPGDAQTASGTAAFRRHDLWLDALAMAASNPDAHLLSPRFSGLLDPSQRAVADALAPLAAALDAGQLEGTAADRLRRLLADLGHHPDGP